MRICVLEHEPESPAGLFADWAEARGHLISVVDVPRLVRWPKPEESDLIVSLGSDESVHASIDPWIKEEIAFVQGARTVSTPVLGICFGAQLLAKAHGGEVRRAVAARAEWREIATRSPDLLPPGPWFRWHEDVLEPPPGARLLAGTEQEPMAFASAGALGLQFHPEVGRELAQTWVDGGRERLASQRIDEDRLRWEIQRGAPGARERAFSLFDAITNWLWHQR
jgi:GMP synthase (glutamine-hydrolysing)